MTPECSIVDILADENKNTEATNINVEQLDCIGAD